MMGYTHALGGAAALAGYAFVTGDVAHAPAWAFGWAALSALVPDTDNHGGSILNRSYLLPMKILTIPLWKGAIHRGRTHSLLGIVGYTAIMLGWLALLGMAASAMGLTMRLNLGTIIIASVMGYASHLLLDMINLPGLQLLWPTPYAIAFPPWQAHGIIPGRFHASSVIGGFFVSTVLMVFLSWWAVQNAHAIFAASAADQTVPQLINFMLNLASTTLHWLLHLFSGK